MTVQFEVFKELIEEFEKSNLFYSVFAGLGLDGRRGKITRDHKDVDIFCHKTDYNKFRKILAKLNYKFYYEINDLKAFQKKGLKLDLCLLDIKGKEYFSKLRYVKLAIPSKLLDKKISKVTIKNCKFNIVADEILKKDALGSQYPQDVEYAKTIEVNEKSFNQIFYMKL